MANSVNGKMNTGKWQFTQEGLPMHPFTWEIPPHLFLFIFVWILSSLFFFAESIPFFVQFFFIFWTIKFYWPPKTPPPLETPPCLFSFPFVLISSFLFSSVAESIPSARHLQTTLHHNTHYCFGFLSRLALSADSQAVSVAKNNRWTFPWISKKPLSRSCNLATVAFFGCIGSRPTRHAYSFWHARLTP